MIIQFKYLVNPGSANSPQVLKTIVANLVPVPLPSDLTISVCPDTGIDIQYSVDYATTDAAAQAAFNALKGLKPS